MRSCGDCVSRACGIVTSGSVFPLEAPYMLGPWEGALFAPGLIWLHEIHLCAPLCPALFLFWVCGLCPQITAVLRPVVDSPLLNLSASSQSSWLALSLPFDTVNPSFLLETLSSLTSGLPPVSPCLPVSPAVYPTRNPPVFLLKQEKNQTEVNNMYKGETWENRITC